MSRGASDEPVGLDELVADLRDVVAVLAEIE